MTLQHETTTQEQGHIARRQSVGRRGLIAGAAALVAGIVAAKTSEPVAAGTDGDIALNVFNAIYATTGVQAKEATGSFNVNWQGSPVFKGDASLLPDTSSFIPPGVPYNIDGIQGLGKGTGVGVVGNGGANSGIGVYGFGAGTAAGVQGFGGNVLGAAGVVGVANSASANNGEGVRGFGANGGVGVSGRGGASNATGVIGFGGGSGGQGVAGIGSSGTGPGVVGVGGNFNAMSNADGVQGFAAGTGVGVSGRGGASNATGVIGFGGGSGGQGVSGIGAATGPGVVGIGGNFGASNNADGVQGFANGTGSGVVGNGGSNNGTGLLGFGGGSGGTGVYGRSTSGSGVYGTADTGGYGVQGRATGTSGAALYGSSASPNVPAFYAVNYAAPNPPNSIAGYFIGEVYINGPLVIAGGAKSAAVPHPDGSHRLLYCVESPESWFEDFGEGTISGGKAEVKLDPDFAAVVDTSKLHVFFTEHGNNHNLHLAARSATGFTVQADAEALAARGKKASDVNGTFTYRVVAKRKDVAAPRFAKFDLPKPLPAPPTPPAPSAPPAPPKPLSVPSVPSVPSAPPVPTKT